MRKLMTGPGLCLLALGCALLAGPADAARSCTGTVSGNVISPLPKGAPIRVHVTDSSPANLAMADRFRAGLLAGGASLSDTGAMTMEFATSIAGAPDAATGTGAVSPEFGLVGRLPVGGTPPVLTMSISLMDTNAAQIDWVGYINCKIRVSDLADVAYDLGVSIARSIGQTFPPRPL